MKTEKFPLTITEKGVSAVIRKTAKLKDGKRLSYTAQETTKASAGKAIGMASVVASIPAALLASAIWAAPATLVTIATFGAQAAAAPAEITAANIATLALSSFDVGGWTGGTRNEPAGVVHGEEFVFSAPAVDRIGLPTLQAMHTGATVAGSRSTAGSSGGGAAGSRINSPVNLHFYDSRPHPKDFLASSEGENMVVNIARKNRLKIGVGT